MDGRLGSFQEYTHMIFTKNSRCCQKKCKSHIEIEHDACLRSWLPGLIVLRLPRFQKAVLADRRREVHSPRLNPFSHPRLAHDGAPVRLLLGRQHARLLQRDNDVLRQDPTPLCDFAHGHGGLGFQAQDGLGHPHFPEAGVPFPSQFAQRLFGPADAVFAFAELVAYAHQDFPEAFALPGREDEDAREVVVVPAHFLFAEEADDLGVRGGLRGRGRRSVHEEVVVEGGHVEEDGFIVEKKFREEGEVLSE